MPVITHWVKCGTYVVEVELEFDYYPGRSDALFPSDETAQYMEDLTKMAEAGDIEALKKAGTVYIRLSEVAKGQ